jgi:DNA-binding CsgD family transcriptional regulator
MRKPDPMSASEGARVLLRETNLSKSEIARQTGIKPQTVHFIQKQMEVKEQAKYFV